LTPRQKNSLPVSANDIPLPFPEYASDVDLGFIGINRLDKGHSTQPFSILRVLLCGQRRGSFGNAATGLTLSQLGEEVGMIVGGSSMAIGSVRSNSG
jgi:hypothetical protein